MLDVSLFRTSDLCHDSQVTPSRQRAAAAFAFATQAFVFLSLSTRLPEFQDRWEISTDTLSFVMLGLILTAGLGSLAAEAMAVRLDSATSLRVGFVVIAVAVPLIISSDSLAVAAPTMALYGFGLGAVDASTNMQAVAIEHRYARPILPSFHGAWTVGAVVASVLTLVSGEWPDAALSAIAVLPVVAVFTPLLRGDSRVPDLKADGLAKRPIMLLGLAMMLFYTVDTAVQTWGTTYAHEVFETTKETAAWAVVVYLVASGLVRMAGDRLVQRHGVSLVIRVGAVIGAAGLVLVVVAPSWPVSLVGYALSGAGLAVVAPMAFSVAAQLACEGDPASRQARVDAAMARFNLFNYGGALLGSVATGVAGGGDIRYGFILPAVLALALLPMTRHFIIKQQVPA